MKKKIKVVIDLKFNLTAVFLKCSKNEKILKFVFFVQNQFNNDKERKKETSSKGSSCHLKHLFHQVFDWSKQIKTHRGKWYQSFCPGSIYVGSRFRIEWIIFK